MSKTLKTLTATTTLNDTDLFLVRQAADTVDKSVTAANLRLQMQASIKSVHAVDYGAKFDGIQLQDITTTNASAVISSASYEFVAADVGKVFALKATTTSSTYMIRGSILSVSGGDATLSVNATASIAGTAVIYFGTDDTIAIQAAHDAVNTEDLYGTGTWKYRQTGVVVLAKGMSMITKEIKLRPCVSFQGQGRYATWLKWVSANTMAVTDYFAMFHGGGGNTSTRIYYDNQFRDFRIDMSAAFTTTYSYHAKCVEIIYNIKVVFIGMYLDSSPATSIGLDYVANGIFCDNFFYRSGRLWATGGGGGSGMDFQTRASNMFTSENTLLGEPQSSILSRNIFIDPAVSAIRCTNDLDTISNARTIISENIVVSKMATGKGIEDNGNVGAIIVGNTVNHFGTDQSTEGPIGTEGQHIWCGIISTGGNGGIIANNSVQGGWYDGIRLNRFQKTGSSLTPIHYIVANNTIRGATRNGIRAEIDATYSMTNVMIDGNSISANGQAGISMTNTGSGGNINYTTINGNQIYDNGNTTATDAQKSGIYINTTMTGLMMSGNYIYDSGAAKQKYGMTIDTVTVSDAFITTNHISGNTTSAINLVSTGAIAGSVTNNKGYQLGASTITVGASPYTYTAGVTPEAVYVSGGTVSGITKNGVTMPTSGTFYLNPNEAIVVTYSVAPTMVKDQK